MKKTYLLTTVIILLNTTAFAQYSDYVGAGHHDNVTVTSCDDQTRPFWTQTASAANSMNGTGLNERYFLASRFLSQASFGKNLAMINAIENMGFEAWIDYQMTLPYASTLETMNIKYDEIDEYYLSIGEQADQGDDPSAYHFNSAWFDNAVSSEGQLRQRVALALSEILVVSNNSALGDFGGKPVASFYDVLLEESFGNYGDLLRKVSLHPAMGFYLSHFNNPKSDPELGTHPDENYAREIMQLFSIGLYVLNQDGSRVLDGGEFVSTYAQEDIKEFAKVFTGLGPAAVNPDNMYEDEPYFGMYFGSSDPSVPMIMYDFFHEPGPKTLLNGFTLQGDLNGMDEVNAAINHLFNHQSVGPFICRQLIQKLVKSNPSPAYISRVAGKFNNNGQGVRGDMKAVVKAILLDEEARDCDWIHHPSNGKLKEPIVKHTEYYKAFNFTQEGGYEYSWNPGFGYFENTDQYPMQSPSVFNFFTPDYQPNGPISSIGLVAPEFQILQTRTSIGYINWVNIWTQGSSPYWFWENIESKQADFTEIKQMSRDPEVLINYLDMVFVNGNMSQKTRNIISEALYSFDVAEDEPDDFYLLEYRAKIGLYLTLISPDYNILK